MKDSEITQRVVGILTQTTDWYRRIGEDPDREDVEDEMGVVGHLVKELTRAEATVPGDATPQEVADAIGTALEPTLHRTLAAFAFAFAELARVHDSGQTDMSSDDVLRQIALNAAQD